MTGTSIIVIDGSRIIRSLDSEYQRNWSEWDTQCQAVHARFKKKTSRTTKGRKVFEYTNWYEENGNGGLKSVGKEEPDYTKYYPPKPKRSYTFSFREYGGDVLLEEKDYTANQAMFRNCLAFPIKECLNFNHTLYKNPLTVPLSVRNDSGISARSPGEPGQKEDLCWNDGGCESYERADECPIEAEEDPDKDEDQ